MGRRPQKLQEIVPSFWQILQRFRPYIQKQQALVIGSMLSLLAEVGLRLLEPWPLKFVFDRVIDPTGEGSGIPFVDNLTPTALLWLSALGLVVVTGLRSLAAYGSTVGFALTGNRVLTEVRNDLYRHLQSLSLSFHTKAKGGELTIRVISDIGLLKDVIVTAFLPLLGNALILVGMVALMFWLHLELMLLALLTVPLFYLATARLTSRIRDVSRKQRQREGAMAATAAESIGAIKIVKTLSLEETFAQTFSGQSHKSLKDGVKAKRLEASLERTVDLLIAIATAIVLGRGAQLVLNNALTPGDLLVFLSYLKNAFKPVKDFAKYTGRLAKGTAAGERIIDLLDQKPEVQDLPGAKPAPPFQGHVEFENITFAYEPGHPTLKDINFSVTPGQQVALVGHSGSGKSTLTSLILRLYEPDQGRILIDGRDIREHTATSLRSQISVVLQESLLFAGSIWDNIAYGSPNATPEEIITAAKIANAHDFIQNLPQGYDTLVSERGVTLSGGQRQRIAIARAAVRQAPILILDEPTTGLDQENEQVVVEALERLAWGKTTFTIAHDLYLAARADLILYVENGRILERGTHQELMQTNGRYAELYDIQTAQRDLNNRQEATHVTR